MRQLDIVLVDFIFLLSSLVCWLMSLHSKPYGQAVFVQYIARHA